MSPFTSGDRHDGGQLIQPDRDREAGSAAIPAGGAAA